MGSYACAKGSVLDIQDQSVKRKNRRMELIRTPVRLLLGRRPSTNADFL